MGDLRRFLAAMMLVVVAAGLFSTWQHRPDPDGLLISASSVSGRPATWPDLAAEKPAAPLKGVVVTKLTAPPIDLVGRAKFPGEDPHNVDLLAFINLAVNQVIQYVPDGGHFADDQQMVSWPADLKGDCEDIALSKLVTLIRTKAPVIEMTRLRFVYAPTRKAELTGHAILEVRLPNGAIAILDNNFNQLMTRHELEVVGYKFFDW